ncbi:VENN motif-containing pre-toxin protein [Celeribacter persicus]|uniref:VENN motif-containing pre-toxin protein n=2 Tax=Celeribacter persicus TaxID=1651082 RepID=A0A2T5HI28_9RHOB|nr:VENN motif-containing pre-toxin protein [Celeribacter persicus]
MFWRSDRTVMRALVNSRLHIFLTYLLTLLTAVHLAFMPAQAGGYRLSGPAAGIGLEDILGEIPENSVLNNALISGFGNGNLTMANILEGALDGAISSGLSSAVYGTDFMEGFSSSLVNTVVNLTLADVQFEIGELFKGGANGGEGSLGHALLHGLAGCAAAEAQGADCAAGAAGGIAASLISKMSEAGDLSVEETQRLASLSGAIAGFVFSGGEAQNVTAGSSVSVSAVLNNYLKHTDLAEMLEELAECRAQEGGCSRDEERAIALHYANVGLMNDKELAATCYTNECIDRFMAEAATYDEVISALRDNSPIAASYLSHSGSLFVSGPAQEQLARNIDFMNGYEDYSAVQCDALSEEACATAYTEAYADYLGDAEIAETVKEFIAFVTGAAVLGPSVCRVTPRVCLALGVADVVECASGNLLACSPGPSFPKTRVGATNNGGALRVTAANPSVSELRAAEHMAGLGRNVELRDPVGTRAGGGTSDLLVDGVPYDVYTPTSANPNRIISAVAKKNDQATGVVVDLSNSPVTREQLGDVLARVNGAGATNITDIVIIGK